MNIPTDTLKKLGIKSQHYKKLVTFSNILH